MNSRFFQPCREIIHSARKNKIIIHGALSVSHRGKEIYRTSTHENADALYDLASLTKVISGLTLFLIGMKKGVWDEESRVADFLPEAEEDVGRLSLRELLTHESGLSAWKDYYGFSGREEIFTSLLKEKTTGKKPVYSDLGFILLTRIIETATDNCVDLLWKEWGLREEWRDLQYAGSLGHSVQEEDIIPTEGTFHRKRILRREVNDDNCLRMDSISLHAGLFGNISSIRNWFWALEGGKIVPREFVKKALSIKNEKFYLGWMKKSESGSNAGSGFSSGSYGMLGFTGSSFFFDPERELLVVFLASRVHPAHDYTDIKRLRRNVFDSVVEGVEKIESFLS